MWLEGLEAVRKCSAAVVGLHLVLGLSMVRRLVFINAVSLSLSLAQNQCLRSSS